MQSFKQFITEAVPWPLHSDHLKGYKKDATTGSFVHPEGHRIEIDKDKGEIHHYTKGSDTPKTFKHAADLHVHLMKLHNNFDNKVKQHVETHKNDPGFGAMKLMHQMGHYDYLHKQGRGNPEENAIEYKTRKAAVRKLDRMNQMPGSRLGENKLTESLKCPLCKSPHSKCPNCETEYPHGHKTQCSKKGCNNAGLKCSQCDTVVNNKGVVANNRVYPFSVGNKEEYAFA